MWTSIPQKVSSNCPGVELHKSHSGRGWRPLYSGAALSFSTPHPPPPRAPTTEQSSEFPESSLWPVEGSCTTFPNASERCGEPKHRFFYNVTSKTCEPFLYHGCPRNRNRYHTLEECKRYCGQIGEPGSLAGRGLWEGGSVEPLWEKARASLAFWGAAPARCSPPLTGPPLVQPISGVQYRVGGGPPFSCTSCAPPH